MKNDPLTVSFPNTSAAEANRLAGSLQQSLAETDPNLTVTRERERQDTQDFGTTLSVVLGSAAVTAVAKGVAAWVARNSGVKLQIRRGGEVVLEATHLNSPDAARIAEALSRSK
jgi:hypothetical protein